MIKNYLKSQIKENSRVYCFVISSATSSAHGEYLLLSELNRILKLAFARFHKESFTLCLIGTGYFEMM